MKCLYRPLLVLVAIGLLVTVDCRSAMAQSVVINEFYPAPSSEETEFIELMVDGPIPGLLEIRDDSGRWVTIPKTNLTTNQELLLLARNPSLLPVSAAQVQVVEVSPWPTLNNGGDSLVVRVGGVVTDRVGYSSSTPAKSWERISMFWPSEWQTNWRISSDPTGSTPGRTNSHYKEDSTPPKAIYAEFEAPNQLRITFSEPITPELPVHILVNSKAGGTHEVRQLPYLNEVIALLPSSEKISNVLVSDFQDFHGLKGQPTILPVAFHALAGQLQVSEILYSEASELLQVTSTPPFSAEPIPSFVVLTSQSEDPLTLRDVVLQSGDQLIPLLPDDSVKVLHKHESYLALASDWPFKADLVAHQEQWLAVNQEWPLASSFQFSGLPQHGLIPGLKYPSGEHDMYLWDKGTLIDSVSYSRKCLDQRFMSHKGRSLIRYPMAACGWISSPTASGLSMGFSLSNAQALQPLSETRLAVTEIMFDPRMDEFDGLPDQVEFIEFVNTADKSISLLNTSARSTPNEQGNSRSIFTIQSPHTLEPFQVAVVFHVPETVPDDPFFQHQHMVKIWPASAALNEAIFIPVRQSLNLSNSEGHIDLVSATGEVVERIYYNSAFHYQGLTEHRGRSLHRNVLFNETAQRENRAGPWITTAHHDGATPGTLEGTTLNNVPETANSASLVVHPSSIYPCHLALGATAKLTLSSGSTRTVLQLDVFDRNGYKVRSLDQGRFITGSWITSWDGRNHYSQVVPTGMYIVVASLYEEDGRLKRRIKQPVAVLH